MFIVPLDALGETYSKQLILSFWGFFWGGDLMKMLKINYFKSSEAQMWLAVSASWIKSYLYILPVAWEKSLRVIQNREGSVLMCLKLSFINISVWNQKFWTFKIYELSSR